MYCITTTRLQYLCSTTGGVYNGGGAVTVTAVGPWGYVWTGVDPTRLIVYFVFCEKHTTSGNSQHHKYLNLYVIAELCESTTSITESAMLYSACAVDLFKPTHLLKIIETHV